jgi:hypothetical protein
MFQMKRKLAAVGVAAGVAVACLATAGPALAAESHAPAHQSGASLSGTFVGRTPAGPGTVESAQPGSSAPRPSGGTFVGQPPSGPGQVLNG